MIPGSHGLGCREHTIWGTVRLMSLTNKLGSRETLRDPGSFHSASQAGSSFSDLSLCLPGWYHADTPEGKIGGREKRPHACDSRSRPLCNVLLEVAAVTSSLVPLASIDHVTTSNYKVVNLCMLASTAEGKGGRRARWVGSWVPNPQHLPRQCPNSVQIDKLLQISRET